MPLVCHKVGWVEVKKKFSIGLIRIVLKYLLFLTLVAPIKTYQQPFSNYPPFYDKYIDQITQYLYEIFICSSLNTLLHFHCLWQSFCRDKNIRVGKNQFKTKFQAE